MNEPSRRFRPVGAGTTVYEDEADTYRYASSKQLQYQADEKHYATQSNNQWQEQMKTTNNHPNPSFVIKTKPHKEVKGIDKPLGLEEDPLIAARKSINAALGRLNTQPVKPTRSFDSETSGSSFSNVYSKSKHTGYFADQNLNEFAIELPYDFGITTERQEQSIKSSLAIVNVERFGNKYNYISLPAKKESLSASPDKEVDLEDVLYTKHSFSMSIPILSKITRYLFYYRRNTSQSQLSFWQGETSGSRNKKKASRSQRRRNDQYIEQERKYQRKVQL
eukprot:snap_masked-scaffold_1-processed-gene-26.29-mRNA-1 protein AED:1.00 eAED:1.00 QI:0/-1/0/0/-1/1/1/0/277